MSTLNKIRRGVEKLSKTKIFRELPHGFEPIVDIKKSFQDYNPGTVFDVGGNCGQSVTKYAKAFPNAKIYSFEPVRETYKKLVKVGENNRKIIPVCCALGAAEGEAEMCLTKRSEMNFVVQGRAALSSHLFDQGFQTETVPITTIDSFCRGEGIDSIGYLKIDTEGHDLDVLKGGEGIICEAAVDFIEVECGIGPENETHVPMQLIIELLQSRRYRIFGVYEQAQEWILKKPVLRRCNLLFISHKLYEN